MIHHPNYGEIKYSTVYFAIDEPVLFSCYFSEVPDKYIGMMVEDFEHKGNRIRSWYFAGVLQNEISMLETTAGKMKELFSRRPVLWHTKHDNGYSLWEKHQGVIPFYAPTDRMTLK